MVNLLLYFLNQQSKMRNIFLLLFFSFSCVSSSETKEEETESVVEVQENKESKQLLRETVSSKCTTPLPSKAIKEIEELLKKDNYTLKITSKQEDYTFKIQT